MDSRRTKEACVDEVFWSEKVVDMADMLFLYKPYLIDMQEHVTYNPH